MSKEDEAKITPVIPPNVNKKINPNVHKVRGVNVNFDPWNVINHLKILIPVGIAMIIVAAVK